MSSVTTWTNFGKVGHVVLNKDQRTNGMIRAFVETGSNSDCILGSFSELAGPVPKTAFYGVRNYGGDDGILITVFFEEPIPDNIEVHITLAQFKAKKYDPPILYTGS